MRHRVITQLFESMYLTELDKTENFLQDAHDFIDKLEKDPQLKEKAEILYREMEKRFKSLLMQKYKDGSDRKNFGDVMQEVINEKMQTDKPEMNGIYLACLQVAGYKLMNPEQEGVDTTNPQQNNNQNNQQPQQGATGAQPPPEQQQSNGTEEQ